MIEQNPLTYAFLSGAHLFLPIISLNITGGSTLIHQDERIIIDPVGGFEPST